MPKYIDTRGRTSLAVGICDRCRMKRALTDLSADPDSPGLRVCNQGCADQLDPWKLPARKTEQLTVSYPRPDEDIST